VKRAGMMLPAFAHADDDNFVTVHAGDHCALSHCWTFSIT
jgi:hypothetical protein